MSEFQKNGCRGHVVGVFDSRESAEVCYQALVATGYPTEEINVIMSDQTRSRYFATSSEDESGSRAGSMATEGIGVGSVLGTVVGASLASAAAIGTAIAIPGLGLVIAGPLAGALAGAGAGAVTGGFLGGLIGLGMTEQNAQTYNEAIAKGGVILSVKPHLSKDSARIRDLMVEHGGKEVAIC